MYKNTFCPCHLLFVPLLILHDSYHNVTRYYGVLMLVSPSCNANYLLRGGYHAVLWRLMLVSPSCNANYLLRGGYQVMLMCSCNANQVLRTFYYYCTTIEHVVNCVLLHPNPSILLLTE